jgi:hypothetical protein
MNKNVALRTAGAIFAIIALLHMMRLITGLEIIVAGKTVPMWPSIGGLIFAALLAIWMFVASRRS